MFFCFFPIQVVELLGLRIQKAEVPVHRCLGTAYNRLPAVPEPATRTIPSFTDPQALADAQREACGRIQRCEPRGARVTGGPGLALSPE